MLITACKIASLLIFSTLVAALLLFPEWIAPYIEGDSSISQFYYTNCMHQSSINDKGEFSNLLLDHNDFSAKYGIDRNLTLQDVRIIYTNLISNQFQNNIVGFWTSLHVSRAGHAKADVANQEFNTYETSDTALNIPQCIVGKCANEFRQMAKMYARSRGSIIASLFLAIRDRLMYASGVTFQHLLMKSSQQYPQATLAEICERIIASAFRTNSWYNKQTWSSSFSLTGLYSVVME